MGESKVSINDILLENIDKEILITSSSVATPVRDTPSISKTSTISKLENYFDENHGKAAKTQLKQAVLRKVKQQFPNETKENGHRDERLCSLHNEISSFKNEIGFLREEVKEKNNAIRTLLR